MQFFLKDKWIQKARIALLLMSGVALAVGIWVAFNLTVLSPVPIWAMVALVVVATVWGMVSTE